MCAAQSAKSPSVGYVIDNFWSLLPSSSNMHAWGPVDKHAPDVDEVLLNRGKRIISFCKTQTDKPFSRMGERDHEAWLRLVGAWVTYLKTHDLHRNLASQLTEMDASNITNLINGKRPLTEQTASKLAALLGVKGIDIRPDNGSRHARIAASNTNRILSKVRDDATLIEDALSDYLDSIPKGALVSGAIERLKSVSM